MALVKKVLVMNFTNTEGRNVSLTVNEPAEGLDGSSVKAAMESIISSGAFGNYYDGDYYPVSSIVSAKYVVQNEEKVYTK